MVSILLVPPVDTLRLWPIVEMASEFGLAIMAGGNLPSTEDLKAD